MNDNETKDLLLDAALLHVPFDGWSAASFQAAIDDTGTDPALARAICPRGAVDLALAYHERGDAIMLERLAEADLADMRFRDRIASAVRFHLEAVEDKELVRRGMTLFALPAYAPDGSRALWDTCDRIWTALGDTSRDINWYTKRTTLSAVYSTTLLYWLGDESPGHADTWEFLDRRIENVMQFEKLKSRMQKSPLIKGLMEGPLAPLGRITAPNPDNDLPGRWQS